MTQAALRMDRMYAWQTGIYDITRRPYLLGRDQLIDSLAPPNGSRVLEIGCGTGRNLIHAARQWPEPWVGADLMELAPPLEGAEASARVAVHLALHMLA